MDYFNLKDGVAHCEDLSLEKLAQRYETPLYVYSKATIIRHCQEFLAAFSSYPTAACFAVKANPSLSYLKLVAEQGFGADIVSLGELVRALKVGFAPEKIVFSGVGKTDQEIIKGLEENIYCFNVESAEELMRIQEIARRIGKVAPVSLRVNPHVDALTNAKITTGLHTTKFGVDMQLARDLLPLFLDAHSSVKLKGLSCHIGSQITDIQPLQQAAQVMVRFTRELLESGLTLEFLGMGGGLGIRYQAESPPSLSTYAQTLINEVKPLGLRLIVEPGRVIAGNTGILLTRVIGSKQTPAKNFAIVDASMSELMRPALYGAYHDICSVRASEETERLRYDVVGPVCETSDTLGEDRLLPKLTKDDLLYIRSCGAYGISMSSNYNSRPLPAEVIVSGEEVTLTRKRQTLEELWQQEIYNP